MHAHTNIYVYIHRCYLSKETHLIEAVPYCIKSSILSNIIKSQTKTVDDVFVRFLKGVLAGVSRFLKGVLAGPSSIKTFVLFWGAYHAVSTVPYPLQGSQVTITPEKL
jgi:hypothetical protein